jgi:hypothetical protein
MKRYCIFLLLLTFFLQESAEGQSNPRRESLRGLKGLEVVVEVIEPQAERLGLTRAQVQTDVELRLRKAGIRVLTEEEAERQGSTYLYINITASEARDVPGLYSYLIDLSFRQRVILERDQSIRTIAATWNIASKGVVGANKLRNLREIVADYIDEFINDYLAANQR